MTADRWYYLRHPEGFSDDLLECVKSGTRVWRCHVEAVIRNWRHTGMGGPSPAYEFFEPDLSADRRVITIPVGGEGSYGSFHLLEETVPTQFAYYLPQWFRIDLELGRKDLGGWFPEVSWHPVVPPGDRESLRTVLRRPATDEGDQN